MRNTHAQSLQLPVYKLVYVIILYDYYIIVLRYYYYTSITQDEFFDENKKAFET